MNRLIAILCVAGAWSLVAHAQTADPNSTDLAPQDRVRGGQIQSNAPGVRVRAAIARHTQYQNDRVTRARFGGDPNTGNSESSSGSGSSGSTGGLSSILDLVNQFGSSGTLGIGSLGDITSLLGGLTNLGGSGTTTTTTTGTDTNGSTGVDPRLQQLLDLRDAAIGSDGTSTGSNLKAAQRSSTSRDGTREFGGAIAKLWKPEDRSQSTDGTTERSFKDRLLESWATAGFTALTVGFQTPQFISFLESGLRTIFRPKANAELVALVQALDEFVQSIIELAGSSNNTNGDDTTNDDTTDGDTTGDDTTDGDTSDDGVSVL